MRFLVQLAGVLVLALAAGGWSSCRDSSASNGGSQGGASAAVISETSETKDVLLPGIDVSVMTPRERHQWSLLVSELLAPCPSVPVSVAQCVQEKRPCATCTRAAKWIASAVRDGAPESQLRRAFKDRFDPSSAKSIPLDGSPSQGPDDAPVTIVELADFECPHCREAVHLLDAVMAAHPGKVRLVYKSFTLSFHVRGEPAARAAFAAGAQGKFWEMEHLLFERQLHLEDADLERYARMLNLDLPRWKAAMDQPAIKERIARDHQLGEDLKVRGTPTIYVNGRELDVDHDESLEERVASELGVPPVAAGSAPDEPPARASSSSTPPAGSATARPR
ncbi:MAG: thioredoxin domain-containing protein [Myxococcota bacterium]|nr:thioredoxin domain-containing protein [Myxococcota bacterium]